MNINLTYSLSTQFAVSTDFDSHILKDALSGYQNDIKSYSTTASLYYRPVANLSIKPSISGYWQTQLDQSDHALGAGIRAEATELNFYGYKSSFYLNGEQAEFAQRTNDALSVRYQIGRQFYESTGDTLILFINRLRRDNFNSFDLNSLTDIFVRNLTQTSEGLENRLNYELSSAASFSVRSILQTSTFRVNNILSADSTDLRKDDTSFESDHVFALGVRTTRWTSNFSWSYRFRSRDDNRPTDSRPDPFGRFSSLGFDTEELEAGLSLDQRLSVSEKDSIGLLASVSKFQYDTSDTTNQNSHDQIRWQATFSHTHEFNEALKLVWRASAFLRHFVFISSKFSSGNNWERNFQISPEVFFSPSSRLQFRQRFIVRARYQTYDFDQEELSTRNSVNRQYIVNNKTSYRLSSQNRFQLGVNLELAEQGRFFYGAWRQRLALSWRNAEAQLTYNQTLGDQWQFALGGNIYNQTRWEHRLSPEGGLSKKVRDKHTNYGPIVELLYRPAAGLQVAFIGNIQFATSSGRNTETINNLDLNVNWFF